MSCVVVTRMFTQFDLESAEGRRGGKKRGMTSCEIKKDDLNKAAVMNQL